MTPHSAEGDSEMFSYVLAVLMDFFLFFRKAEVVESAIQLDSIEPDPEEACRLLREVTGREWRVMTREGADCYARGCNFALCPDIVGHFEVLVISNPWPNSPEGPKWVVYGSGDIFLDTGAKLGDLLTDADVLDALRGKITADQFWERVESQRRSA